MNSRISTDLLSAIPQKKIVDALEQTIKDCPECSKKTNIKLDQGICDSCRIKNTAITRYAEANIPVKYWNLEMDKHFYGDVCLLNKYKEITVDLKKSYQDGVAVCFAGAHGLGKTFLVANILKKAVVKGYSALYVNLNDIVSVMLNKDSENKAIARKELLTVDFLVIDEFDPRYMSNDKSSDLFGKILEDIFRTRSQNTLPILMCTNSPNVVESFQGAIRMSISSLMSLVTTIPVLGKDYRKIGK